MTVYKGKVGFKADITGAMQRAAKEKLAWLRKQQGEAHEKDAWQPEKTTGTE